MKKPYFALVPSGYAFYKLFSILPTNGDADFDFYRSTGSSRVAENGLIKSISSANPTLDWLNSSCPRLKIEESRTNLQKYSEDFTQPQWLTGNLSVIGNDTIDPKGVENADKIIPNTNNTYHYLESITSGSGYAIDTTYSVFVKKGGFSQVELLLAYSSSPGSPIAQVKFDLDTLETFGTTIGTAFEYQDYGNGWYRLQINALVSLSASAAILRVAVLDNQSQTFQGNDVDGLFVWGAQLESYAVKASSYITTYSSISSRAGDQISPITLMNNDAKGTVFLDLKAENLNNRGTSTIMLSDNSYNRIVFSFQSDSRLSVQVGDAPSSPFFSYNYIHNQQRFKIAVTWERYGNLEVYINGVNVAVANAGSLNNLNTFQFSSYSSSNPFQGDVYQSSVYNEYLTNSELIELTKL